MPVAAVRLCLDRGGQYPGRGGGVGEAQDDRRGRRGGVGLTCFLPRIAGEGGTAPTGPAPSGRPDDKLHAGEGPARTEASGHLPQPARLCSPPPPLRGGGQWTQGKI